MSDPTPGAPDQPEHDPEVPEESEAPEVPEAAAIPDDVPEAAELPEVPASPEIPEAPAAPDLASSDETMRVPVAPEVSWDAPEPPRAMPWEAPAAAPAILPLAATPPPGPPPADGSAPTPGAPAAGVLSAATVGWVAPPPRPLATGNPGWVIASTGIRFVAYIIDGIFIGLVLGLAVGVVLAIAPDLADGGTSIALAYGVASAGLYYVYFVGFWTGDGQATPGMRLLKLRVANASDGKRLGLGPATVRWLALGYIFTLVSLIPALFWIAFVAFIWDIVLLLTTATDKMHQGLHDKWAKSVVVRPETAGAGSGLVAACLIIVVIVGFFVLVSIVALIFLGSQLSDILSAVGSSI